jgi:hypothetical protein
MAVKVYGSVEAYENANRPPEPVHIPGLRAAPNPFQGSNNVHVVSTRKPFANNNGDAAGSPVARQQQGSGRRPSVLDSFVARWLHGSKDDSAQGARTASTAQGATKPRANSMLFSRRASTTATQK